MATEIVDHRVLAMRKRRAWRTGDSSAWFLMRRAVGDLEERLAAVDRRFPRAAVVGSLLPWAADALAASGKVDEIVRVEAYDFLLPDGKPSSTALLARPETVPLPPAGFDLVVSLLGLHEANDIPGMLVQIRRALKPDGLFLGAMAGGDTLAELRQSLLAAETELTGGASPRVMPFADVRDAGGLLQRAGFALPVADVEELTVRYDDLFALMRDLRAMGATSALAARRRGPTARALFPRAAEIHAARFADPDGRIRATFSIIWMSGWAPDPGQPKPLRPGSARVSLTKVLGSDKAP